jgi:FKBP-type peptidyl-prolyl cis-trans isomerase
MRFCLLLFGLLLVGTMEGQIPDTAMQVSKGGYEYIRYTNLKGPKPQSGDFVYYHTQIRSGDSVLFASRMVPGQVPNLKMGEAEAKGEELSPVEDVLSALTVGDSVTIFLPLDNKQNRMPGFEDASVMPYDVVLIEIIDSLAYDAKLAEKEKAKALVKKREAPIKALVQKAAKEYQSGALDDQLIRTSSGLDYLYHEKGKGEKPEKGNLVSVHYYGCLTDGRPFDNSFQRGTPFVFDLGAGRVIRGWDEGIALLEKGSSAILFIPPHLGYGAKGAPPVIPPDAKLIFYVEVLE